MEHMPIRYEITRLPDGKYKLVRLGSLIASFSRVGLEGYLGDSVSRPRLDTALLRLDSGEVTVVVVADLESASS